MDIMLFQYGATQLMLLFWYLFWTWEDHPAKSTLAGLNRTHICFIFQIYTREKGNEITKVFKFLSIKLFCLEYILNNCFVLTYTISDWVVVLRYFNVGDNCYPLILTSDEIRVSNLSQIAIINITNDL